MELLLGGWKNDLTTLRSLILKLRRRNLLVLGLRQLSSVSVLIKLGCSRALLILPLREHLGDEILVLLVIFLGELRWSDDRVLDLSRCTI